MHNAQSQPVTVTISVTSINHVPTPQPDTVATPEDVPLTFNLLSNDGDVDEDTLAIQMQHLVLLHLKA